MKVYILTYTNKIFVDKDKRSSGIDQAAIVQYNILKDLGHDVRIFAAQTNLDQEYNCDYFINYRESNPKEYGLKNRKLIEKKIISSIHEFQPDVIITNKEISKFYVELQHFKVPIIYISHAMPGFFADLNNANMLHDMISKGNTFCCVSEYHKRGTIKYYKSTRKGWDFDEIIPDFILNPQYADKFNIKESDGIIKHVSAASKAKDTFLINIFCEDTNLKVKTFTTTNYLGCKLEDPYITDNLIKYKNDVNLDINHSIIMDEISTSMCSYVGNYPDTFTITSLEALSRGVPLIVKDKNGHPATEMIEEKYINKYIKLIKTKTDFLQAVEEFKNITYQDRIEIANSTYKMMGKESYMKKMSDLLQYSIDKYKSKEINSLDW